MQAIESTKEKVMRTNMVHRQIMPSGVISRRLLKAMWYVPREIFVPKSSKKIAYADIDIKIISSKNGVRAVHMLAPRTVGKMLQALDIKDNYCVLDVGAGFGYTSVVSSLLCNKVVALTSFEECYAAIKTNLDILDVRNVITILRPVIDGVKEYAPYDRIIVGIGTIHLNKHHAVLQPLLAQLSPNGGRLAVIAQTQINTQRLYLFIKNTVGKNEHIDMIDVCDLYAPFFDR